jgi:TonB family protein
MSMGTVESTAVKPGSIAFAAGLLASVAGLAAAAAVDEPPPRMDSARLAQMTESIASAPWVRVEHTLWRKEPVRFSTQVPCFYSYPLEPWVARLDSSWVMRFRAALGIERATAFEDSLGPGFCARDTSRRETLNLAFPQAESEITCGVSLDRGYAQFRWRHATSPPISLRGRAAELKRLLVEALPADQALGAVRVCAFGSADTVKTRPPDAPVQVGKIPGIVRQVKPKYPMAAQNANIEGTVQVQALVSKDGNVVSTLIVQSIPQLDAEAVRAVEQWQFEPALVDGKPSPVWVVLPVRFRLK